MAYGSKAAEPVGGQLTLGLAGKRQAGSTDGAAARGGRYSYTIVIRGKEGAGLGARPIAGHACHRQPSTKTATLMERNTRSALLRRLGRG